MIRTTWIFHILDPNLAAPRRRFDEWLYERIARVMAELAESLFKHLKYCPTFPDRFASYEVARAFCHQFFPWYNDHHRHSGIAFFTPSAVHHHEVEQLAATRTIALNDAFSRHPERFVHGPPAPRMPPAVVYINPPMDPIANTIETH